MPAQTVPAPAPTAARSPAAGAAHQLKFARNGTKKILEGIADDKMCVIPSGCAKHALWIMSHLASTDDWFMCEFGGQKSAVPAEWQKLFAMNSTAVADASKYPPVDQVRKALDAAHAAVIKWVSSLSADDLAKSCPRSGSLTRQLWAMCRASLHGMRDTTRGNCPRCARDLGSLRRSAESSRH